MPRPISALGTEFQFTKTRNAAKTIPVCNEGSVSIYGAIKTLIHGINLNRLIAVIKR